MAWGLQQGARAQESEWFSYYSWLLIVFFVCGVVMGLLIAAADRDLPWVPSPIRRTWRYVAALKTVGWDERGYTNFLETFSGMSISHMPTSVVVLALGAAVAPRSFMSRARAFSKQCVRHIECHMSSPVRGGNVQYLACNPTDLVPRTLDFG